MEKLHGVKELKEVISFLGAGFKAYAGAMEDGKIGADDLAQIMVLALPAGPAFEGIGLVGKEAMEIDGDEKKELYAHIDAAMGEALAEKIGESVLIIAVEIASVLSEIKAKKAEDEKPAEPAEA